MSVPGLGFRLRMGGHGRALPRGHQHSATFLLGRRCWYASAPQQSSEQRECDFEGAVDEEDEGDEEGGDKGEHIEKQMLVPGRIDGCRPQVRGSLVPDHVLGPVDGRIQRRHRSVTVTLRQLLRLQLIPMTKTKTYTLSFGQSNV